MHADGNHPGMEKGLQFSGMVFDHAVSVLLDNLRERGMPSNRHRRRTDYAAIHREFIVSPSFKRA